MIWIFNSDLAAKITDANASVSAEANAVSARKMSVMLWLHAMAARSFSCEKAKVVSAYRSVAKLEL
jgi:hypothetical protein